MHRALLAVLLFSLLAASPVSAAPLTLEGMGMVAQWTDVEGPNGEMPGFIWGTSDADGADRIGLYVEFASGLTGSITYSGVSSHWNSWGFSLLPDTATGFMTGFEFFTHLFNVPSTTTTYPEALPMAWTSSVMAFSNNFDLDYNPQNGSHFRASVTGWRQATFTTYSSTANVVPEPVTVLLLGTGLGAVAARRRLKKRA